MFSEFALWQEIALVGLAALAAIYVFYFRIWVALAMASDLLFVIALSVCVASVAAPGLFDPGARRIVDLSPLPAALAEADSKVAALETLPQRLIAHALERVGYSKADAVAASQPQESGPGASVREAGPFESRVRPAVEALVSVLMRVSTCMGSFVLLLMALALRSSTATARELRTLGSRLEQLEAAEAT